MREFFTACATVNPSYEDITEPDGISVIHVYHTTGMCRKCVRQINKIENNGRKYKGNVYNMIIFSSKYKENGNEKRQTNRSDSLISRTGRLESCYISGNKK